MKDYCYTCMNELTDGNLCHHCLRENTPDDVVYRLRPGTILNNKYLVGNCIGEGGFGITYIGRDLTLDMRVAIKEYYPNGYVNRNNTVDQNVSTSTESQKTIFYKGKDSFLEEARKIAKFVGEPGIVGVREYFEENGTAYIIMDYLDGVNLATYVKRNGVFPAQQIFELMLPITRSLKRIHDAGIIHRDISPDNIMYLRNGTLKLMDFGSARYFTNAQKEMSVLLKQGYAPEEQYRKNGDQGPWTDVYGLCATIYRCITGVIPEDALDRLRGDNLVPPSKMGIEISEPLETVLMYGLAVFKENRCRSMDELSDLIEKALSRRTVTVPQTQAPVDDVYRTQLADGYYKTQLSGSIPPTAAPQTPPRQTPPAPKAPIPRTPVPKAPSKDGGKKAVTAIIAVSSVIIIATAALLVYLFAFKDNAPSSSPASSAADPAAETPMSVTVPACESNSLAYAQTLLEGADLVCDVEYAYSDDVQEDLVISQSVASGTEVDPGSTVVLTVSKGAEPCPYDYSQKLTVTAASGSSSATATLYEWKGGDWSKVTSYTAKVAKNGIGKSREGSATSPEGVHKLGVVLYKSEVDTNLPTYKVTSSTGIVSDTASDNYNLIIEAPNASGINKFDSLEDEFSYAAIFIEFNGDGFSSDGVEKGAGSAIFVRGQSRALSETLGDVDISESDMKDLLSRLDADKTPMIELKVD